MMHGNITRSVRRLTTPTVVLNSLPPQKQKQNQDIDYSLRKMIDPSIVNVFHQITDDINDVSFIFYESQILKWVTTNRGEQFVRSVFNQILSKHEKHKLSQSIMADIGANMGYYGLLSLSHGIGEAIFFDPQPACTQIIESLVTLNAFNERARIVNHPIGDKGQKLEVPTKECGGRFPVNKNEKGQKHAFGQKDDDSVDQSKDYVSFITADTALGNKTILITKIDTEGFELNILPLLFRKFQQHQLVNVIVEITPFWWKNTGHSMQEGAEILAKIIDYGYKAEDVLGNKIKTRKEMIEYISNEQVQKEQLDLWLQCVSC